MSDITIRSSRPADAPELSRLAALDSQSIPAGDLLVAEVCGDLVAAHSLQDGRTIADPFRRTADVVALLRMRGESSATPKTRLGIFALPRAA